MKKDHMKLIATALIIGSLAGLLGVLIYYIWTTPLVEQNGDSEKESLIIVAPYVDSFHNQRLLDLAELYEYRTGTAFQLKLLSPENYLEELTADYSPEKDARVLVLDTYDIPYLVYEDYIADCSEIMEEISAGLTTPFSPELLEFSLVDKKHYAIPFTATTYALIYNQDLFRQYNLTPPATWEELVDTSLYLSSLGRGAFSLPMVRPNELATYYLSIVCSEDFFYDLNGPAGQEILSQLSYLFFRESSSSSVGINYTDSDLLRMFRQQEVSMLLCNTQQLAVLEEHPLSFRWDVVPVPMVLEGGGGGSAMLSGRSIGITKGGAPGKAEDFIRFIYDENMLREFHLQYGSLAVQSGREDEYAADSRWFGDEFPKLSDSFGFKQYRLWDSIVQEIGSELQSLLLQEQTWEVTAENMQEKVRDYRVSS